MKTVIWSHFHNRTVTQKVVSVHSALKKYIFLWKIGWYIVSDQLNICLLEAAVFDILSRSPVWPWNNPLRIAHLATIEKNGTGLGNAWTSLDTGYQHSGLMVTGIVSVKALSLVEFMSVQKMTLKSLYELVNKMCFLWSIFNRRCKSVSCDRVSVWVLDNWSW